MSTTVRVDDSLYKDAQKFAKAECRSPANQINYWAKIGKAALENPELPIDFLRDILIARGENLSLAEPFLPKK